MKKVKYMIMALLLFGTAVFGMFGQMEYVNATEAGFTVDGTRLLDPNGNEFITRGVNNAHIWFDTEAYAAIADIAAIGANTVRIVWRTDGTAARLGEIIQQCKNHNLLAVPELVDASGSDSAVELNNMANYWARSDIKAVLDNYKDCVIINIANEWGDQATATDWYNAYATAIQTMRNAGITHTLMIDSNSQGQNGDTIISTGPYLKALDSNLVFSVHMYSKWNNASDIGTKLQAMKDNGLCVIVGEFGYNYNNGNNDMGCNVDANEVMKQCQLKRIGYMPWSWNCGGTWLDMTSGDWTTLTSWGNWVIYGDNGIQTPAGTAVLYNFENSIQGWSGSNLQSGPWYWNDWQYRGYYSIQASINLASGSAYYLKKTQNTSDLSGKSLLKAVVRHAAWGNVGTGMLAKLYVKTGSSWQWFDGGYVPINSGTAGTILTMNLSGVADLSNVREMGIQFVAGSGASDQTTIYADYVTVE